MKLNKVILLFIVLFCYHFNYCQLTIINGVINKYAPVINISNDCFQNIVIDSTYQYIGRDTIFNKGDTILIIQMKGVDMVRINDSTFGNISNINYTGNYEFGIIKKINNNSIILEDKLKNNYAFGTAFSYIQIIKIPSYKNALVSGSPLTCLNWDESTKIGGILAFFVQDTLFLNDSIDVTGKGFKGGIKNGSSTGLSTYGHLGFSLPNGSLNGAKKGEGIYGIDLSIIEGRGNYTNGGGGGNSHNSGGGGGSNKNKGGNGGAQACSTGVCSVAFSLIGGKGGVNIPSTVNKRLFLGGGGGAGDQNDNNGTNGANGGGGIIINSPVIIGNNNKINANGSNALNSIDDGAGGGGGGGSIIIKSNNINNLSLNINGGNGGNTSTSVWTGFRHGPGGGGSGGYLQLNAISSLLIINNQGGNHGIINLPITPFPNNNWGSTDGEIGIVDTSNFLVEIGSDSTNSVSNFDTTYRLFIDTTICKNDTFKFKISIVDSFFCSENVIVDSNIIIADSGYYYLTSYIDCNIYIDTFKINFYKPRLLDIGNDTFLCSSDTFKIFVNDTYNSIIWNTGELTDTIKVNNSGLYYLTTTDLCNIYIDSIFIEFNINDIDLSSQDTQICNGDTLELFVNGLFDSIIWQNNSTVNPLIISSSGLYYCSIINQCGIFFDTVSIDSLSNNFIKILPNDTSICNGDSIIIYIDNNKYSIEWQDGSNFNYYIIKNQGEYIVKLNDGCFTNYDTLTVNLRNCNKDTINNCKVIIPSAFSPNNDNNNDYIRAYTNCNNINNFNLKIFNRWGEQVFTSNNITDLWDGTYKLQNQPMGVYAYFLLYSSEDSNNKINLLKGNITLIR